MTGTPGPSGAAPRSPHAAQRRGTGKAPLVSWVIAAGLLAAVSTTQTWVSGGVDDPVLGHRVVGLTGSQAAPVVLGLGLTGAAAGLAAAVAGRVGRTLAAVAAVAVGVGVVAAAVGVLRDPAAVAGSSAAGSVGRAGHVPVSGVATTSWPVVAAAAGVFLALGGVAVVLFGRTWGGLSTKYETPATRSLGAPQTASDGESGAAGDDEGRRRRERRISDWDRLTTGDDPTLEDEAPPPGARPLRAPDGGSRTGED